jgi:hypothetical protein
MLDFHAQEFRKQLVAGVPIAVGSDVGPFPHGSQARELVLMVRCGMTPMKSHFDRHICQRRWFANSSATMLKIQGRVLEKLDAALAD